MNKISLEEQLSRLLVIATDAHFGQYDKGGNPYILHPLAVMHMLRPFGLKVMCVGIGHDLFEDTKVTRFSLLNEGIDEDIVEGIWCMTKLPGETQEEYEVRVFSNELSMLAKRADVEHNSDIRRLKGVAEKDIKRMVKYHNLYMRLNDALKQRGY